MTPAPVESVADSMTEAQFKICAIFNCLFTIACHILKRIIIMLSSCALNANLALILLTIITSVVPLAYSIGNDYRLQEGETLLLFKDVMDLAKRAMNSDDCGCSPAHPLTFNPAYQRRISELIRHLEDLAEAEASSTSSTSERNRRVKRFLHTYTFRRRIVLPPGTRLTLTPTFHLPFIRDLPQGFVSNMTLSYPLAISFDDLGLTDESNIFGVFPILRRVFHLLFGKRKRRAADYSGGHRLVVYQLIENVLYNLGIEGRECLLRAICEIHEFPLDRQSGLIGETLQFLLTASNSPDAGEEGTDYIIAEKSGRERGECWHYYSKCRSSLFQKNDNEKNYV